MTLAAGVEIRPASVADADQICVLLEQQFADHRIDVPRSQLYDAIFQLLEDPCLGFVLVVHHQTTLIGVAVVSFNWSLEHGGKVAWLDELYLVPAWREQGIGGVLLHQIIDRAVSLDCRAMDLEIDEVHRRAEALYRREGFTALSRSRWVKVLG